MNSFRISTEVPPSPGLLASLAWSQKSRLAAAALLMTFSAVATAGYAYLVGPVLRYLFLGGESVPLPVPGAGLLERLSAAIGAAEPWMVGLTVVVVAGIKGVAHFGQVTLTGQAGQRLLHGLRLEMYRGLVALNPLDPRAASRGELVTRFTIDVEAVEKGVTGGLIAALRDGLQILALAGLALALDPVLGLVGLAAFPPVALMIVRIGKHIRRRRAAVHSAFGELGTAVDETAGGLAVIRSFGAGELLAGRFSRRSEAILFSTVRAIALRALSSPVNELLGASALAATLWYAHLRIAAGLTTPEAFVSFFSALLLLYQPVKGLGQAQHAVQAALAALERLTLLGAGNGAEQPEPMSEEEPPGFVKEVGLEHACAGYDREENVLRGVDLTIRSGGRTAVVGPSGAGKTTLYNLLLGFLPLREGRLLVNGEEVSLTPSLARGIFAPVPQEPYLFDDTIRMNVLCGRPGASAGEVDAACRAGGVERFVRDLTDGLDTRVGPGGRLLSQGQRQRVCLARALVSQAPVLLLDEVTASLDGETEQALVTGLDDFLDDRTVLVITHRLATAEWADEVVLLEEGVISSAGSPVELLGDDDRVRRLFGRQKVTGLASG